VKLVNSVAGPVVRFTRYTYNPYAQEGQSVHEWETVGEAKVTTQEEVHVDLAAGPVVARRAPQYRAKNRRIYSQVRRRA
jgi:hypothetical protein